MYKVKETGKGNGAYRFHCPGCLCSHIIPTTPNENKVYWNFNNDLEKPTFTPSINYIGYCHFHITNGQIQYLGDCNHEYAGRTIDMLDIE